MASSSGCWPLTLRRPPLRFFSSSSDPSNVHNGPLDGGKANKVRGTCKQEEVAQGDEKGAGQGRGGGDGSSGSRQTPHGGPHRDSFTPIGLGEGSHSEKASVEGCEPRKKGEGGRWVVPPPVDNVGNGMKVGGDAGNGHSTCKTTASRSAQRIGVVLDGHVTQVDHRWSQPEGSPSYLQSNQGDFLLPCDDGEKGEERTEVRIVEEGVVQGGEDGKLEQMKGGDERLEGGREELTGRRGGDSIPNDGHLTNEKGLMRSEESRLPGGGDKQLEQHGIVKAENEAAAVKAAVEAVNGIDNHDHHEGLVVPAKSAAHLPSDGATALPELIHDDPVWAVVRAEAHLEARKEPLLSSYLYASILGHSQFEKSLGMVLANCLGSATLLPTELQQVFEDVLSSDNYVRQAIRADVQAVKDRDPACVSYHYALLYLKGYQALQGFRIAHTLWERGRKVLALALQCRISELFGIDIHPAAKIGRGILIPNSMGVVIGETAVVGDRVSVLQYVTLGGTGKQAGDRHPKVRDGVFLGVAALVIGNIVVGEGSMVASGSVVLKNVPPHCIVAGIPAKVIEENLVFEPTLAMNR